MQSTKRLDFGRKVRCLFQVLSRLLEGSNLWLEGHLVIFPRTFTVGTDDKSYTTLSVDRGYYQDSQEPLARNLNRWDKARIPDDAEWGYIATRQLDSGPVHVAVRGKCLVFSAGYVSDKKFYLFFSHLFPSQHALVCHLGLEGNITAMDVEDFRLVVAECVPGPNKDPVKAAQMRSFVLPAKFREPTARSQEESTTSVLGAIVTPQKAYVVTDFSRIACLHVVSSARKFTEQDLTPQSLVRLFLFRLILLFIPLHHVNLRTGRNGFGKCFQVGRTGSWSVKML